MKEFLILSVGPIPSSNKSVSEGGGLRAWGLAVGLAQNGIKVTLAQPEGFKIENPDPKENIKIIHWSFSNVKELCEKHDSFYLLYSRGDLTSFIANNVKAEIPVVVDCYVPIYIEALAREISPNLEALKKNFEEVNNWNQAFQRGDYFLCANQTQFHFYQGVLSAFGRINPLTFSEDILETVPYGIHQDSPTDQNQPPLLRGKKIKEDDFLILWFGGLYPWFNITPLLESVEKIARDHSDVKLAIVGGKNPFVTQKKFQDQYEAAKKFAKKNDLLDRNIFFRDWVPYEERYRWYREADVVVNLHNITKESSYAWRTRVIDFIGGEIPIITSPGDEISDLLREKQAGIVLEKNDGKEVSAALKKVYEDRELLKQIKQNLQKIKPDLYWGSITKNLAGFIKAGRLAPDRQLVLEKGKDFKKFYPASKAIQPGIRSDIKNGMLILKNNGLRGFFKKLPVYFKKKMNS